MTKNNIFNILVLMKTFIIKDIPNEMHSKFKIYCLVQGQSMSQVLRNFMAQQSATISIHANDGREKSSVSVIEQGVTKTESK